VRVPIESVPIFENNTLCESKLEHFKSIDIDIDRISNVYRKEQYQDILRVNSWLEELGYENSVYRKPKYFVTKVEERWAKNYINRSGGRLVVGVSRRASVSSKEWNKFDELIEILEKERYQVIVLDEQIDGKYKFTVRELGAIVDSCDVIISNDSYILHLAGALDVRTIGLFGYTKGKVICQNYSSTKVLQGKCHVAGVKDSCWYNLVCGMDLKGGTVPCLKQIKVEDVIAELELLVC